MRLALFVAVLCSQGVFSVARAGVSLDPGFSGDGRQTRAFDLDSIKTDAARRIFKAADGGYWVAGSATDNGMLDLAVAKFDSSGTSDSNYDGDGRVTVQSPFFELVDVAIDSADRLVFVGTIMTVAGSDIGVMRINADGSLDTGFGSFGLYQFASPKDFNQAYAVTITPGDHILLAARFHDPAAAGTGLAIGIRSDGQDDDFQNLGITVGGEGGAARYSMLRGAALLAYPRVLPGSSTFCMPLIELTTLSLPGGLVSVNASGLASNSLSGDCSDITLSGVAEASDNSLVMAGSIDNPLFPGAEGHRRGLLLRFQPDGLPDNSFDGDGVLQVDAPFPQSGLRFDDVLFDSTNGVLVGGSTRSADATLSQFALARLLPNGDLDNGFGSGSGFTGTVFSGASGDSPQNIARSLLQDGDRILLAGSRQFGGSDTDFAIAAWADLSSFRDGFESP